eukprot:TRINITY_DN1569_c0_g2_i4.p1 TRINITY_DN1569_c0_g2~~TRINITY_DN1569_c0_g2_i4.p1  ORF type:complete len:364 (-),score=60.00 TRINITY_DN1569_c0_g2_i4:356-1447(-)
MSSAPEPSVDHDVVQSSANLRFRDYNLILHKSLQISGSILCVFFLILLIWIIFRYYSIKRRGLRLAKNYGKILNIFTIIMLIISCRLSFLVMNSAFNEELTNFFYEHHIENVFLIILDSFYHLPIVLMFTMQAYISKILFGIYAAIKYGAHDSREKLETYSIRFKWINIVVYVIYFIKDIILMCMNLNVERHKDVLFQANDIVFLVLTVILAVLTLTLGIKVISKIRQLSEFAMKKFQIPKLKFFLFAIMFSHCTRIAHYLLNILFPLLNDGLTFEEFLLTQTDNMNPFFNLSVVAEQLVRYITLEWLPLTFFVYIVRPTQTESTPSSQRESLIPNSQLSLTRSNRSSFNAKGAFNQYFVLCL